MVGAKASTAMAVIGPMPGMDMRRAVLCERFASDLSAFSSDAIREESTPIWSRYSRAVSTTIRSRQAHSVAAEATANLSRTTSLAAGLFHFRQAGAFVLIVSGQPSLRRHQNLLVYREAGCQSC